MPSAQAKTALEKAVKSACEHVHTGKLQGFYKL